VLLAPGASRSCRWPTSSRPPPPNTHYQIDMDGVLAAGRRALLETKDFSERHERIDRDAACEEASNGL